jgi:hypothetical protein
MIVTEVALKINFEAVFAYQGQALGLSISHIDLAVLYKECDMFGTRDGVKCCVFPDQIANFAW